MSAPKLTPDQARVLGLMSRDHGLSKGDCKPGRSADWRRIDALEQRGLCERRQHRYYTTHLGHQALSALVATASDPAEGQGT